MPRVAARERTIADLNLRHAQLVSERGVCGYARMEHVSEGTMCGCRQVEHTDGGRLRWRVLEQVLEKPGVPCAAPDCQSLAPEQPTPPEHVRVCDPVTGCHMVKGPALRPRDDLADQVLKGQDSGEADPLGIFDELGDHRQPAAAVLGARHEDHSYRQKWGEPISDFLMGGWDLQQGRTANAHETKEHEKDEPLKYPRYFPHTKGVWSGAKPPEVGGDDDTAAE